MRNNLNNITSADDKKKFYANALQSINDVSGVILASLNCLLDPPEQDFATEAAAEDTAETE